MGQAGRARVEARHDINRLNDELVELYERLARAARDRTAADVRAPFPAAARSDLVVASSTSI